MNNQEIQIIIGILLLLVYVYCIRNNEGYRGRGADELPNQTRKWSQNI